MSGAHVIDTGRMVDKMYADPSLGSTWSVAQEATRSCFFLSSIEYEYNWHVSTPQNV